MAVAKQGEPTLKSDFRFGDVSDEAIMRHCQELADKEDRREGIQTNRDFRTIQELDSGCSVALARSGTYSADRAKRSFRAQREMHPRVLLNTLPPLVVQPNLPIKGAILHPNNSSVRSINPFCSRSMNKGSEFISLAQVANAFDALCFMNSFGVYMNVEMTVVPRNALRGGMTFEAGAVYQSLMSRFSDMCYHRWALGGVMPIPRWHITIFENSDDRGVHFHTALFVPEQAQASFKAWLRPSLTRILMLDEVPNNVLDFNIRSSPSSISQWKWFSYLMKGIDPTLKGKSGQALSEVIGLEGGTRNPGKLFIKRVRVSEALSQKHRHACGHQGILSRYDWDDVRWKLLIPRLSE